MASRKTARPAIGALIAGMLLAAPALAESPTGANANPNNATPTTTSATEATLPSAGHDAEQDDASQADAATAALASQNTASGATNPSAAWQALVSVQPGFGRWPDGSTGGDHVLRLVVRADTGKVVAAKVGLSIGLALLGGVHGGVANGFSKKNLRGDKIETLPSPAFGTLQDMIKSSLATYFTAHPGAVPTEARVIQASAGEWSLIYQKLSDAQTPYELRHDVEIGFPLVRKFLRSSGGEGIRCTSEPALASLEQWQADDYLLVKQASERYAAKCIEQFVAKLPMLFPDNSQAISTAEADGTPAMDATPDASENHESRTEPVAVTSLS